MSRFIATTLAILTLIASAGVLSACNTTAGAGRDVAAAGHVITNSADKVKSDLP